MLMRKVHKILKKRRQAEAQRRFDAVPLNVGDVVIDCGANVGDVVARVAKPGVRVYAFEPNAEAFSALQARFAGHDGVVCLQKGVGARAGTVALYMHRKYQIDPMRYSQASSMLSDKRNVQETHAVEIEVVRLADFISKLNERVKLLKIDIEGMEFEVLNDLIDSGAIEKIDHVFCETHELAVKRLWKDLRALKRRIARESHPNICLDWK